MNLQKLWKLLIPRHIEEFLNLSSRDKKRLVEIAMDNIERFGSLEDRPTEEGRAMRQWLERQFQFIGVSPNTMYIKTDDSQVPLIHPWGMTTLLFKHKRLPFVVSVNAEMRLDEMKLQEIPFNRETFQGKGSVKGLTG